MSSPGVIHVLPLAHRNGRLIEIGHPGNGFDTEVLHHRDHMLDRPLDMAAIARLAVEVLRGEDDRE
jgi:hypothetical protein